MGVDPWVDRIVALHLHLQICISSYFLKWMGRPVFCPLLFRGRHFCTNAHGIHWMITASYSLCKNISEQSL